MAGEKIEVLAYSGYRGEEIPRSFICHDKQIKISEILSMWIEESLVDKLRKRFFKVKGFDGVKYKIYYDEEVKEWFLAES